MENLVGRQIKGFAFRGHSIKMKSYVGKTGVVVHQYENKVSVKFHDWHVWQYPLDKIQPHLIPLEVFKLGQKVWDASISEKEGVVVGTDLLFKDFSMQVQFNNKILCVYKNNGENENGQKTLSTTPYTFQGFSQETIIERGTLVYMKDTEDLVWYFGFYDEFKNANHHCFDNQQKEGESFPWSYCQTENPLI